MLNEVKIWAQMFFDDGSVSEGRRIPVETLDDDRMIEETANSFLRDLNRSEGLLLMWGAGSIVSWMVTSTSSPEESEISESSPD